MLVMEEWLEKVLEALLEIRVGFRSSANAPETWEINSL
jgi:hypothetical protein